MTLNNSNVKYNNNVKYINNNNIKYNNNEKKMNTMDYENEERSYY